MPLDPIVSLTIAVAESPGSYAFLLGSGVSRDAGVPTGAEVFCGRRHQRRLGDRLVRAGVAAEHALQETGLEPRSKLVVTKTRIRPRAASTASRWWPPSSPASPRLVCSSQSPSCAWSGVSSVSFSSR